MSAFTLFASVALGSVVGAASVALSVSLRRRRSHWEPTRTAHRRLSDWIAGAAVVTVVAGAAGQALSVRAAQTGPEADPSAAVIARYRDRIPVLMAEQGVPGLAVSLVDADRALWVEGFGYRDHPGGAPVTPDTMFSVQSMSKLFTATAVMQSVAAGRVKLDEPITTYLPDFTVHSAFEAQPERKVTLRTLLSHTAGFTHEAPIGNNNELDPGTFEAHVRSISDTWLRFPVGSGYAYSNLGIDLAGYVLERVEGRPFADVMRDSLLAPLAMERSSFDRDLIRATDDRAVGHVNLYPKPPLDVPMTAAGGLYASAADLARFLRFQLNDGSVDGLEVLDAESMGEMRSVQGPRAGEPAGWGLGVVRHRWNRFAERPELFDHGGGGFGFLSDLWWSPDLGIGIAVLTNSQDHHLQGELALSILGDLAAEPGPYRERLLALPSRPAITDPDTAFEPPAGIADLIAATAMGRTGDEEVRWAARIGAYAAPAWGVTAPEGLQGRFLVDSGVPFIETTETGSVVRHPLVEVEPDLFLADNGETLDLRGSVPTWRGLRLVRLIGGPSPWQWAVLGAAALVAASWLVARVARTFRRSISPSPDLPAVTRRWRRATTVVATATALLMVGATALMTGMPGLVDSGFLGWLELPIAERVALHLPIALTFVAAVTALMVAAGCLGRWWAGAERWQYVALSVASIALVAQLAAWRLIGWGIG